jgi:hypothetical protein
MSLALQSKVLDCATACFHVIRSIATEEQVRRGELIRLTASCGITCLETARSCQVGSVLPELEEECRLACTNCIEAYKNSELQSISEAATLIAACKECLEAM